MKPISLSSQVKIGKQVVFREINGELVLLNLKSGFYFGLDPVGSRMWLLLKDHERLNRVLKLLLQEYSIEENACRNDLLKLVTSLQKSGLIEVS